MGIVEEGGVGGEEGVGLVEQVEVGEAGDVVGAVRRLRAAVEAEVLGGKLEKERSREALSRIEQARRLTKGAQNAWLATALRRRAFALNVENTRLAATGPERAIRE